MMPLLKNEPPGRVHSLTELFAIAAALENEAAQRYADLAEEMLTLAQPDIAEVFRYLAAEERGHVEHVRNWSCSATGAAPASPWTQWQPPETFDEEEARSIASSSLASAYRALSMAVRNEERAFVFWTYVAAQADDAAVQAAAERMAEEELHHAALLRRERRRAFHAERGQAPAAAARQSPAVKAVQAERALATLLRRLAEREAAPPAELQRLAGEAAGMAAEAVGLLGEPAAAAEPLPTDPAAALPEALRQAERAVEAYLDAAEAAQDEATNRGLQALAERAIGRLALLRRLPATQ